jgi:predicted small lipoprotein YifL
VAVAAGLTFFAHRYMGFSGDLMKLIVDSVTAALAASGAFSWLASGVKPLAETKAAAEGGIGHPKGGASMLFLVACLSSSLTACGSRSPMEQVEAAAPKMVGLQKLTAQAQDIIISANKTAKVPSDDDTAKIMVKFKEVGAIYVEMGKLLQVIDSVGATPENAVTVREKLNLVRSAVRQVILYSSGANRATLEELVKVFDNVDAILAQIEASTSMIPAKPLVPATAE